MNGERHDKATQQLIPRLLWKIDQSINYGFLIGDIRVDLD